MYKTALKVFTFLAILVVSFSLQIPQVIAGGTTTSSSGCVPVYGGGVQCPRSGFVLINKQVLNPRTGVFVDNLFPSDPVKYRPEEIITFQLIVQNSGDQNLDKVVVKDTIPFFVDYMSISGPTTDASYDSKTRVLTFTVTNLLAGTNQVFTLKVRTVHPALMNQNTVCPINVVTAEAAGQTPDRDESQFCIQKQAEVPVVPKAGPEHWILSIGGLGTALIIGLYLKKKATI